MASPPKAVFTLLRSNFINWVMVTYFKSVMYRAVGVPEGFVLTPEFETELKDILATTIPSSGRVDGFYFDCYSVTSEFNDEISETSSYSVYKIETPALVINALDDPLANHENVRGLAEKFPNARLYIVPYGGHPLLGHAEEVEAEITQFLRSSLALLNKSH